MLRSQGRRSHGQNAVLRRRTHTHRRCARDLSSRDECDSGFITRGCVRHARTRSRWCSTGGKSITMKRRASTHNPLPQALDALFEVLLAEPDADARAAAHDAWHVTVAARLAATAITVKDVGPSLRVPFSAKDWTRLCDKFFEPTPVPAAVMTCPLTDAISASTSCIVVGAYHGAPPFAWLGIGTGGDPVPSR